MHTATQRARANKRKADQQRSKGSGRLGGWGEAEEPDEETPSSLANLLGQGSSAATDESAASAGFAALRRSSLKRASTISLISSRASPATLERMASMTPRSLTAPDAPKPPKKSIGLSAVSAFVGDRLFSSRHGTKRGSSTTATERGSASTCEKLSVAVSTRSAEERRSAAESLDTASWLFDSARRGEVALVRASWLLRRAGFERADVDVPVPMARSARVLSPRPRTLRAQGAWVRDVSVGAPTPLPPRQTLEAECPEAYIGADELEKAYARLSEKIDAATDEAGAPFPPTERESLDVAPLVLFSHCWETAAHPDPTGHTLLSIATALAGTWEFDEAEVRPASGMPVYALWGYDEIGVYIDWCSLYQGRAPPSAPSTASPPLTRAASTPGSTPRAHSLAQLPGPPLSPRGPSTPRGDAEGGAGDGAEGGACDGPPLVRTAEQEKSYAAARARTAHWFAHRKSAVCILRAQQGLLVPRRRRGWPLLEEAAARLIKRPPPPFLGHVFLPAVEGRRRTPGMRKVSLEGFPERRAVMTVDGRAVYWERTRAPGEAGPALSPTLSPSLFGAELRRRFFSVPADVDLVVAMYADLVADAFGHAPTLSCRGARWGDPEMAELAKLLREVPHPNVSHLDLSRNPHVTNLIALGSAISNGALAMLTKLDLSYCRELVALPAGIATLSALVELILEGCNAFEACPSLSGLTKLRVLNLANCLRVTALPPGVQHLRSLSSLDAWGCRALRALPDLARLRSLRTVNISYCRALGELPPLYGLSSLSTLKMRNCSAVLYLPRSVGALGSLRTLDLFGCRLLETLPDGLASLGSLVTLDLRDCSALERLPDALGRLGSLRTLRLGGCARLAALPDSVASMRSLEQLDVAGCAALQSLPRKLCACSGLRELDLRGCDKLIYLPDISRLPTLQVRGVDLRLRRWQSAGFRETMLELGATADATDGAGHRGSDAARLTGWFEQQFDRVLTVGGQGSPSAPAAAGLQVADYSTAEERESRESAQLRDLPPLLGSEGAAKAPSASRPAPACPAPAAAADGDFDPAPGRPMGAAPTGTA